MRKKFLIPLILVALTGVAASDVLAAARSDLVARVVAGELSEARLSWWGYDPEDATKYVEAALASGVRKLIVDAEPGPWYVRTIHGRSNLELVVEKGALVCAKRGAFRGKGDFLFDFNKVENVTLRGPGEIRMWREDYTNRAEYGWSEWRHAVSFQDARNVLIENIRIARSGGDGIYLRNVTDVIVRGVTCDRHYRQGISVISAENLLIERCTLTNTRGTPPEAGIDFEPNRASEKLVNCTMRDCTIARNHGSGILVALFKFDGTTRRSSLRFENCRVAANDRSAFELISPSSPVNAASGDIAFVGGLYVSSPGKPGFTILESDSMPVALTFDKVVCREWAKDGAKKDFAVDRSWLARRYPGIAKASAVLPARHRPDFAAYTVVDRRPAEMSPAEPVTFRDPFRLAFHAPKAGPVRFEACQLALGPKAVSCEGEATVRDAAGAEVCRVSLKGIAFDKPTPFVITVPKRGFHTIDVPIGRSRFRLTSSEVPVAADLSGGMLHMNAGGVCGFHLPIREGDGQFAFFAAGDGSGEGVRARLTDPSGSCVFDADECVTWRTYLSDSHPAAGMWKVVLQRAARSPFDDYYVELSGTRPFLFLTADKYWE